MNNGNSFCIEPWRQVHIDSRGLIGPCCEYRSRDKKHSSINTYLESDDLDSIKKSMRDDLRINNCRSCYKHEDKNVTSMRQRRNSIHGKDYQNIKGMHLMLTFGNLCNMACRICNPSRSQLVEKHNDKVASLTSDSALKKMLLDLQTNNILQQWYEDPEKLQDIKNKLPLFASLEISGGEPFINKSFIELIQYAIDTGIAKDMKISITTNASFSESHLILLKSFKEVHLNISTDGIKSFYDYTRWPKNWTFFEEKVELLKSHAENISWTFVLVPHNLNLLNIPDAIEYFLTHGRGTKRFSLCFLNGMEFLHPKHAPSRVKLLVIEKIQSFIERQTFTSNQPHHNNVSTGLIGNVFNKVKMIINRQRLNRKLLPLNNDIPHINNELAHLNNLITEISQPTTLELDKINLFKNHTEALDKIRSQDAWSSIGWDIKELMDEYEESL
jgi:MoaA/NifB/PqqE/SkfB family radical SAM enzyme